MFRDLLPKALEQPAESQKYSNLENVTTFGVAARKARDNDPAVHTNQDMFSCGSLSARFSTERLVRSDGCNDFGFARWVGPAAATCWRLVLLPLIGARRLGLVTGAGVVCCVRSSTAPVQQRMGLWWQLQLGTSLARQLAATKACWLLLLQGQGAVGGV